MEKSFSGDVFQPLCIKGRKLDITWREIKRTLRVMFKAAWFAFQGTGSENEHPPEPLAVTQHAISDS